jgi:hypothetical protein
MHKEQHYNVVENPEEYFTRVPNELVNDNRFFTLGIDGFRAFALVIRIRSKSSTYRFWRNSLAEEMGFSVKQLDRAIAVAKQLGWLEIVPTEYIKNEFGRIVGSRTVWKSTFPEKYTELTISGEGVSPEAGEGVSPEVEKHSKNKNTKNKNRKDINTPNSVSQKSGKEKADEDKARGLVYSLAREVGLPDPEPSEALVAGMILMDELTHYQGKKAIPLLKQGFVEARKKIEQGEDADYLTVDIVAAELRDSMLGIHYPPIQN